MASLPIPFPTRALDMPRTIPIIADEWCITHWLDTVAGNSENTRRSYLKEASRWRAYLMARTGDTTRADYLGTATEEDASQFLAWISSDGPNIPEPVAQACGLSPRQAVKPRDTATCLLYTSPSPRD